MTGSDILDCTVESPGTTPGIRKRIPIGEVSANWGTHVKNALVVFRSGYEVLSEYMLQERLQWSIEVRYLKRLNYNVCNRHKGMYFYGRLQKGVTWGEWGFSWTTGTSATLAKARRRPNIKGGKQNENSVLVHEKSRLLLVGFKGAISH